MPRSKESYELVVAEDSATARDLLLTLAKQRGIRAIAAEDGKAAMELVRPDTKAVLLDLGMPVWDGFRCLDYLAEKFPGLPAIVLSSQDQATEAVRALKLGAVDYVTKPFDPEELFAILFKAFELSRMRSENESLRDAVGESFQVDAMVAESAAMSSLMKKAQKIAPLNSSVLLTGESGVGKGLLARTIHSMSPRAGKPFVTVSCPALPRELLESELFGHEKGAFTGAVKRRIGKIESAAGGTLFLDEIGELPLDLQPKLLNVLQDREFQRVGGEATLTADIRLIAATNIDFEEKVADGSFRSDLYYRLSVIPLEVPPLRERPDEIGALCSKILSDIARRRGNEPITISADALALFMEYGWPGNVREMENILERCSAFCDEGVIQVKDLPESFKDVPERKDAVAVDGLAGMPLAEIEKTAITQTLKMCGGNKAEVSRRLGISEKSVYNKIKSYGISSD